MPEQARTYWTFSPLHQTPASEWLYQAIERLPEWLQEKTLRLQRPADRFASVRGYQLLQCILRYIGHSTDLSRLYCDEHQRPQTPGEWDFNISHSATAVACAWQNRGKVGIDIEDVIPVDPEMYKRVFHPSEWRTLESEKDARQFFTLWTRKEALIKAQGRGMLLPLEQIAVLRNVIKLEGNRYFVHPLNTEPPWCAHLVTDIPDTKPKFIPCFPAV